MPLGVKVNSKFVSFGWSTDATLSKTHPAAANDSYSRVESSSLTGGSEEHQLDMKSPWGSDNIAVRTSVWRDREKI